jgi:hypothetical protein
MSATARHSRAHQKLYGRAERGASFRRDRLLDPRGYYPQYLPGIRPNASNWQQARCPFHEDRTPSLSVNLVHGGFRCFGCGAHGGDVLAFHMQFKNIDFKAAAQELHAWEDNHGNT